MSDGTRAPAGAPRRRITMERTFQAPIEDVWELWTTREGIESWWGPDGFRVEVRSLDLRPGGELRYAMIATGPQQIAFMKQAGMPLVSETRLTFREVAPPRRLAYDHEADFIPGVAPYGVAYLVELEPDPRGVRLVLSFEAMHDEVWTQRATMGWEMELVKLQQVIAGRAGRPRPG
jgi:uncharacterized protein YndB with AHSA1/START domain